MTTKNSKRSVERGEVLLNNSELNRATAFSIADRKKYGLLGLLPEKVETEAERLQRVLSQIDAKNSDLERYEYLSALHDNDETLYMNYHHPNRYVICSGWGFQFHSLVRDTFLTHHD